MTNNCILVLGLPRSGTSMIAGILYHFGVFMGHNLLFGNEINESGFFENLHLVHFHANSTNTLTFKDIVIALKKKEDREIFQIDSSGIYDSILMGLSSASNSTWGFKDPRLACLPEIADNFISVVQKYNSNIKIIYIKRNTRDIARSLNSLMDNEFNIDEIEESIIWGQNNIENKLREMDMPKLFFTYENVLKNKYRCVNTIMHFCEINNYSNMKNVVDFIDPTLRRF